MANSALNKLKSRVKSKTLVGKQKNLDVNKNGKLDKEDFKILRGDKMAKGGFVAVGEKDGYWTIMSKPTTKEKAQEVIEMGVPRGEVGKVVTLEEAKAHKNTIGKEYLQKGGYMAKGGLTQDQKEKLEYLKGQVEIANASFDKALNSRDKLRIKSAKKNYEEYKKDYNSLKYNYPLLKKILRDNGFETPKYGHSSIRGTRPVLNNHYEIPDKVSSPDNVTLYIKNKETVTTDKLISDLNKNGYTLRSTPDFTTGFYQIYIDYMIDGDKMAEGGQTFNADYWEDYYDGDKKYTFGGLDFKTDVRNSVQVLVKNQIKKWNEDNDDNVTNVLDISESALKFVGKKHYISNSIIDAMIMQEGSNKMAEGGEIPNNYKGKKAEQVWNEWTIEQKRHFLEDHEDQLRKTGGQNVTLFSLSKKSYDDLPLFVGNALIEHITTGQYADGGEIKNQYKGKKAEQVWNEWTDEQKKHFLRDHKEEFPKSAQSGLTKSVFGLNRLSYDDLPLYVSNALIEHVTTGQYADGGRMDIEGKLGDMSEKYQEWLDENNLPKMSADELLVDESVNLTEEQRRYIKNFIHEWEEEQDKYEDGGETYDKTLFQKELAEFKQHIKDGYGWISPTNVLDSWELMGFKTDVSNVNSPATQDLYKDLIDSKLLYHEEYASGEKGERVESFRELYGWNYGENVEYANGGKTKENKSFVLVAKDITIKADNVEDFIKKASANDYTLMQVYNENDEEVKSKNPIFDFSWKIGLPRFKELVGPMKDGPNQFRYEDEWVNERMSVEKGGYMKDGGEIKKVTDGDDTYYLTYIDSTHFYLSNSKDYKGNAFHIAEFRSRPFYNEVKSWLKSNDNKMANGGTIAQENNEMLQSNMKEIRHHSDELKNIVTDSTEVEPWVIAKTERASTDLSDVTHYLDGEKDRSLKMPFEKGGYMAEGGFNDNETQYTGTTNKTVEYLRNAGLGEEKITKNLIKELLYKRLSESLDLAHQLMPQNEEENLQMSSFTKENLRNGAESIWKAKSYFGGMAFEKGGYMSHGGMTAKERKIASQLNQNSTVQKTMTVADKANRFLQAVRLADNDIKLKDITVEASPRGNWVVFEHGKVIMTVNQDMLDEETIRTYNLEHHN